MSLHCVLRYSNTCPAVVASAGMLMEVLMDSEGSVVASAGMLMEVLMDSEGSGEVENEEIGMKLVRET